MSLKSERILWAVGICLLAVGLAVAIWFGVKGRYGSSSHEYEYGPNYDYEYGPKLQPGEKSYSIYRKEHMDQAAQHPERSMTEEEQKDPRQFQDAVGRGMDTWYWWTGGNQAYWRRLAVKTAGLPIRGDLLAILHRIPRSKRWEALGTINDPDCVAAEKPDQYGLMIDRMKEGTGDYDYKVYGWSSGIVGLRLFPNSNFERGKWSIGRYLKDPASVEPPYLVGMSCAICHVSFNPLHPPKDASEPTWDNLASMIGNQYFQEGSIYGQDTSPDQFLWQYTHTQQPGTSETSRLDTDFINNPNAINSIYRLKARLKLRSAERVTPLQKVFLQAMNKNMGLEENTDLGGTDAEPTHLTAHILKDGADSMGVPVASLRVWVNIGMMDEEWTRCWAVNPWNLKESVVRGFKQIPFDIAKVRSDPNSYWMQTEKRMVDLEKFARTFDSYPLKDAKEVQIEAQPPRQDGKDYLTTDQEILKRGKIAFADHCVRCHNSKPVPNLPADEKDVEGRKKAWEAFVLSDTFLDDNYLSDDKRWPVSDPELHTNAARALGTNALSGQIWDNFSSETYKKQPDPLRELQDEDDQGRLGPLYNPRTGKYEKHFSVPIDHVASYRTPSLVSIWATAPYLHNNSVGIFNKDPSVAGRMAAFEDGMSRLLWPERRLGIKSIKVATQDCRLPDLFDLLISEGHLRLPHPGLVLDKLRVAKGTPLNLIANLKPQAVPDVLEAYVQGCLNGRPRVEFPILQILNKELGHRQMLDKMLDLSTCPDFIEDKGHTYGRKLEDEDKKALIEFMKTF